MKVEIDTHTHTIASGHAYNTMHEMATTAAAKGLKGLAITDHAPKMPGSTHIYYFQNLKVVPRNMCGIELLLGTELNIMNEAGEVDLPQKLLSKLDLVIASMHIPCFQGERSEENVTRAYENVMQNEYVDIIGHPDDGRFPADSEKLVWQAKRTGTLLEVNNSSLRPEGTRVNTRENCLNILRECRKQSAGIVLGSDAHIDVDIAEYPYACKLLEEVDFPEKLIANVTLEKLKASLKRNG